VHAPSRSALLSIDDAVTKETWVLKQKFRYFLLLDRF